jgi:hypothetical protein
LILSTLCVYGPSVLNITLHKVCDLNQSYPVKSVKNKQKQDARRTVGQEALELFQKGPQEVSPVALQREMTRDYYQNLIDCTLNNRQKFKGKFFIIVITKNERLLPNVFRNYFFARRTCPTPDYDQSVFRYNNLLEEVEYLWTIPSQDACYHLLDNINEVHRDEHELLSFVIDFKKGKLFQLAKKLNGERDTPDTTKEYM